MSLNDQYNKIINIELNALIDTGALHGDYISNKIIKQHDIPIINDSVVWICTGVDNACVPSIGRTAIKLSFFNEQSSVTEYIALYPTVIDGPIDLIIGKQSIFQHDLLPKLHEQIWGEMEMQMTEGPYRGDASAGSSNLHHHPVANHLVSTILKGAYFSTEDEEELYEIEASMDALDMNVEYDGERTTSTNVIPKILHELCEGTEFR